MGHYVPTDVSGKELAIHGGYSLRYAIYYTELSQRDLGKINWHWHCELQFCLITRGEVRVFVDQNVFTVQQGDGCFINSKYTHKLEAAAGGSASYICLDVHPSLLSGSEGSLIDMRYLQPYLQDSSLKMLLLRRQVPWQREILEKIAAISDMNQQKPFGYELEITTLIQKIWLNLIRSYRVAAPAEESLENQYQKMQKSNAVTLLITYIQSSFACQLSLKELAQIVNMSSSECCRLFKATTGSTIFSYIQTCRLAHATLLLLNTDLSVSQIAYESGFSSASYFIETFKKRTNMTPLQYRKLRPANLL